MTSEEQNAWVIGAALTTGEAGYLKLDSDGQGRLVSEVWEATAWANMHVAMILGEAWAETQPIDANDLHGLFAEPIKA